jgi:hypothetical protein
LNRRRLSIPSLGDSFKDWGRKLEGVEWHTKVGLSPVSANLHVWMCN